MIASGDDVLVTFEGREWPGTVLKLENSGYVLCRVHFNDPLWDFGRQGARIDPEQIVAVRSGHVREA